MIEESIFQPVNNFEYPDLPNIDLNSSLDSNNLIYNYSELLKDKAEEKYNKDLEDWINSHNEDLGNDLDNLFYPETNNQTYKFKQSKGYNAVKSVMDKLVTDSTKKNILLKIAEKEYNFKNIPIGHNAVAAASYLIMFIVAVVMMCTGFAMYAPTSTWFFPKMFTWVTPLFGGDELKVRMVHHILMWAFILFIGVHFYLVLFHDWLEGRGESSAMVSGYKFCRTERCEDFEDQTERIEEKEEK